MKENNYKIKIWRDNIYNSIDDYCDNSLTIYFFNDNYKHLNNIEVNLDRTCYENSIEDYEDERDNFQEDLEYLKSLNIVDIVGIDIDDYGVIFHNLDKDNLEWQDFFDYDGFVFSTKKKLDILGTPGEYQKKVFKQDLKTLKAILEGNVYSITKDCFEICKCCGQKVYQEDGDFVTVFGYNEIFSKETADYLGVTTNELYDTEIGV